MGASVPKFGKGTRALSTFLTQQSQCMPQAQALLQVLAQMMKGKELKW